jgi:predicted amidophosphoribosyltransferase
MYYTQEHFEDQDMFPTIFCPTCRAENPIGAAFCDQCGGTLGREADNSDDRLQSIQGHDTFTTIICPHCHAKNAVEDAFCDQCGGALGESEQSFDARKGAEPLDFCTSCGNKVEYGVTYCDMCGAFLGRFELPRPSKVEQRRPQEIQHHTGALTSEVHQHTSSNRNRVIANDTSTRGNLLKFLGVAVASYGTIWTLIEPLGLFGLEHYLMQVKSLGFFALILPSLMIAYGLTYSQAHFVALVNRRQKLLTKVTPVYLQSSSSLFFGKYRVVRKLYDQPMSTLYQVLNELDGKTYLLKTIKNKSTYSPQTIESVLRAYENSQKSKWVALPLEILEDSEHYYEVLPYFNGETLFRVALQNSVKGAGFGR